MNTKYLSALLAIVPIALGASSAMADSSDTPQFNFSCQMSEGIPTTVAQLSSEVQLPIFHRKQDALNNRSSSTPQQLCDSVTAKLKEYSDQGYDLSQISFVGTHTEQMPLVCANTSRTTGCNKVLFTLGATEKPEITADEVVAAILDPRLQQNKLVKRDRGVQSTSYQVNFWQLLGLGPNKFFGK